MIILVYFYKSCKVLIAYIRKLSWIIVYLKFKLNRIDIKTNFVSNGVPVTMINLKSRVVIGDSFMMNNGKFHNMIGRQQPCYLVIDRDAELIIGDNVGISSTAIICWCKITIENNVRIGGGTVIYDTDFHSLDYKDRIARPEIRKNIKTAPILIKENVFIGSSCTILKGVTIGRNSIIGACSVVSKSIPENEIWAGNPIRFIKKI